MCKPIFIGGDIRNITILLLLALLTPGWGQDPPEEFQYYEQSLYLAFYHFNLVTIDEIGVESNDWVGAFKGDVCVGAMLWDTSDCTNGVCYVPILGDDGYPGTEGYMQAGDFPTFKIYDASEDMYYDAIPSENIPWSFNGIISIALLNATSSDEVSGCTDETACNYNPEAIEDDGSCEYNDESGCTEPTEVGGNISGTWTLENSPYLVTQDILLQPSDTLIIEPGVQVYMSDNLRFDIYGLLTAEGTESDSIRFTQDNDYWLSINFADAADDNSVLSYCVIEGASNSGFQPYYGSVNTNSSHPTITHNYFRHIGHNEGRTSCNGINLISSHAIVDSNRFEDIMGHGIYIDANSTPEIRGNTFIDINGYGIYVDGADDVTIVGNTISSRYSSGIYATNTENLTISDNVIVENNDRGIYLYQYNLYAMIVSNTIEGNNSSGIDMNRYNDYLTISYNSITENGSSGIYIASDNDYMEIAGNEIRENNNYGIDVSSSTNRDIYIFQNTIMDNNSDGIRFSSTSYGDIIENLIVNNGSYGLYLNQIHHGDCVVRNNTIDGHSEAGLYWDSNSSSQYTLTATNNSITNNNSYGMNIQNGGNYNTIAYNNAYNNTSEPNYNYYGDLPTGVGISTEINNNGTVCDIAYNISTSPLYIDSENGNYYIEKESPNIDAGDPSLFDSDGTISDIGRYPYQYDLLPTPSSIDFGLITVGTDSTAIVTLSANLTDIEVSAIETSHSQFTVSPNSFTILYGESQDVEITFTPETNTLYDGNITILSSSEDYSELLVPVTGTGFIPPDITINPQQVSMSLLEGQSGITRSLTIGNSGVDDLNWSLAIVEDSREDYQWEFNNCGQTGYSGPSQSECDSEYGSGEVILEDGIQYWTVPYTGTYSIEVMGAQGGDGTYFGGFYGGMGAHIAGEFTLTEGDILKVLVGQEGANYSYGGAGGGGTFVTLNNIPLLVAGGGGGSVYQHQGGDGLITESGGNGQYSGGTNGNGGGGQSYGSGGGGYSTNGSGNYYGYSFLSGGNGNNTSYDGGFGGGAGRYSWGNWAGCGGGGYSGGGGSYTSSYGAGGGGSYNSGENQDNVSGINEGHGQVAITYQGSTDWVIALPGSGTVPGSTSSEITFTFDATTVGVGDYSADVHIFSNDPDEGEVIIPVTLSVFSENTSYMYADNQQVARSTDAPISLKAHASAEDNISGIAFALSIHPVGEDVPEIEGELGLSIVVGYGADAIVTQTGPGEASIYLSGFDPPLNNEDIDLGYIMMPVPGTTENGDTYSLTFSNVSGTTEDYELIEMEGMQNITLTVITGPPEIDGLYDVYLLENSAMTLGFTVNDLDGSDIMMELTEAPDYVTLNFETGGNAGTIDIAPGFGAESAQVTLTATNSEDVPEVSTGSFDIFINHYPTLTPTETVYILEGESTTIEVTLSDVDGDTISLSLQSAPDYVEYVASSGSSGTININTYNGAISGDVVFDIYDTGSPQASTTSGFTVIINSPPEFVGFGDMHVVENQVLDTLISFYDPDGDPLDLTICAMPEYINYTVLADTTRSSGNRNRDCTSGVCLSIENVNTDAGILDIYMTNQAGCSYCTDNDYNNQNGCVNLGDDGSGGASWVFDSSMTEADCTSAGDWFNGEVGGFQFKLPGVTITGASGGTASEYFANVNTTSSMILGVDFSGGTIPPGSGILTQVTFTDFAGQDICFGEDTGSAGSTAIGDANGNYIAADWGDCYCALTVDECGVCGGSGIPVGDCDCYGNVENECGICGGGDCLDCNGVAYGDSVIDNCGTCDNDPSNDCDMDCSGEWGGSLENDECGVCGGDGITCSECPEPILTVNNAYGILLSIMPTSESITKPITFMLNDPGGLSIVDTYSANIYNTYLSGDVRPHGDDINGDNDSNDAGEFGDDLVLAPDVAEALAISTIAPGREIPPDSTNLFDSFDTSPQSSDQNNDGDEYDAGERGGDGNIYADDVIVTLKRATGVAGFENIRMVDNEYPYSTSPSGRNDGRDEPVDMLVLGNVQAAPGAVVNIPVTLVRGESETLLNGLVSGFAVDFEGEDLELIEPLAFIPSIDCSPLQIPTGVDFLSLLMMDMSEQSPETEILLGHIAFTVPENAVESMIFTISSLNTSGSSPDYSAILFTEGTDATVTLSTSVNQTVQTGVGWNWFSINVQSDDMSLNNVLNALDATAGDFIKSQSASAEYYAEFGWYGSLSSINPVDMYQLDIANGGEIAFTGYPVDPSSTIIHLTDGWNWIGYIPQNAGIINDALGSIGDSGIFIKNQAASAEYYGAYGWYGSLDFMSGGDGYQLQIIGEADLIYPNFEADDNLTRTMEVKEMPEAITEWSVNPHAYEFNGAITLSVENREDSPGDYIAAFVEGECRGIAERMDFPFDDVDRGIYILMAYSNMDNEEELTFKYFSDFEEEVIEYTESLEFTLDMVVGNGFKPFSLSREFIIPEDFSLSAAYPNPFNPVTTINYGIPEDSKVTIQVYSLQGRIVEVLTDQNLEAGYHSVIWNADNHASGMYFVKMHAGNYISTQKLMLVK